MFKFKKYQKTDIFFIAIFILFLNYLYFGNISSFINDYFENKTNDFYFSVENATDDNYYNESRYIKKKDSEIDQYPKYIDDESLREINNNLISHKITEIDIENSIKNYLPNIRGHLSLFKISNDKNKIIFHNQTYSSACCNLYIYYLESGILKEVPDTRVNSVEYHKVSPNRNYILYLDNEGKELFIRDTENGIKTTLFLVQNENETLIKEHGGYGGNPFGEFDWTSNDKIYLNVFEINPKYPTENNKLLYYKEIDLIL